MRCHYCYSLYARSHCFLLQREGEEESKEFPTISDAIVHIENLPESDGSTLCIHNQLGHRIGQLLLNCGTRLQLPHPNRFWSPASPHLQN
jgi:hypothetical protein